jgi:asparagine synthase (glutamine-hydrolysing)
MMRDGLAPDPQVLALLSAALHHRGPDSDATYVQDKTALVETRLAIVDVAGGQQPFYGPRGAVLIANGEIYNAPSLRADMADERFKSLSDCEPLVHLFERLGPDYAERLRGMYGVAIYEPGPRRLTLSRDQFGIKPLYYVQTPDLFAYASEIGALVEAGLVQPRVVERAERELLQLKHITGDKTILEGVHRIAPGQTLTIENAAIVDRSRIPMLATRPVKRVALEAALDDFDRVMTDSVAVHLQTDVPYGLFFSGGIDSSILLTLMQRLSSTPIQALTLGYGGGTPEDRIAGDESWGALEIAAATSAQCKRIEMTADDFWRLAPRIVAALDDPTTDAAILPTYMLGQAARAEGLKVVLCGEGADELFGGYSRYRRARLPSFGRSPDKRGVFDAVPGLDTRFGDWSRDFDAIAAGTRAAPGSRMAGLQALDCIERLPNSLLVKLDRCLMAHSVEGRTPFLDREVMDFAVTLPDNLKTNFKYGKVLLREWLARANPVCRPFARKKGFNPPVGAWMAQRADELGALVSAQPAIAALAGRDVVRGVFTQAQEHHQPAWSLLFYALWHTHHVLRVPCDGDIAHALGQARG